MNKNKSDRGKYIERVNECHSRAGKANE